MEATTTITAPVGETFTHSAYVQGDSAAYDVEVGPRLTFRRTPATEVKVGDRLMDSFGQPTVSVEGVRISSRTVRLDHAHYGQAYHTTYGLAEVLNVFVSSEDVA